MFTADNSAQLYHIFLYGGLGFLLGAYYDLFRLHRLLHSPGKGIVFCQDLLFLLSSTLLFFLLTLVVTGGIMRWYLFGGVGLGFGAYRMTVGWIFIRVVRTIVRWLRKAVAVIRRVVFVPLGRLLRFLGRPFLVFGRFFIKIGQKPYFFLKKLLKNRLHILYTNSRLKFSSFSAEASAQAGQKTEGGNDRP